MIGTRRKDHRTDEAAEKPDHSEDDGPAECFPAQRPRGTAEFSKHFVFAGKSFKRLERVMGIEPTYSAWKAAALPLSYTRTRLLYAISYPGQREKNSRGGT